MTSSTTGQKRFLIIDQSLKDADGHHYEMDMHVARAAAARGFSVFVAGNAAYDTSLRFEGAELIRHFSQTWTDAKQSSAAGQARRWLEACPPALRKYALSFALAAKRTLSAQTTAAAAPLPLFGAEAVQLLRLLNLGADCHVLAHTLGGLELKALIQAIPRAPPMPTIHIVLRRGADDPAMNTGIPGGLADVLATIASDSILSKKVRLYCDTEALSAQHRAISAGLPITTLPIPLSPLNEVPTMAPPRTSLLLAYLGNARTEKGFQLLPDALDAIRRADTPATLEAQANSGFSLDEDIIVRARRRLAASGAILHNAPLDEDAYRNLLLRASIVLLPYNADLYRVRSSGVLVQALAAGKPVVVPANSWLADTAPAEASVRFGNGVAFADAVMTAIANIRALSAVAEAKAPEWRAHHTPSALVDRLLAPIPVSSYPLPVNGRGAHRPGVR